ncbi:MAG: hypothetical protein KF729_01645 [Sandaracinaceae bacterium]|nr:hypothetical protein [Sandaracinaceae bacterium]
MAARVALAFLGLVVSTGCSFDPLYTYCDDEVQCGTRSYSTTDADGERGWIEVPLACIEATVNVSAEQTTIGNFCTVECSSDRRCTSGVGLPRGVCIEWEGDRGGFCYQLCTTDEDCYPSSRCHRVYRDGVPLAVCLPTRR